jgi:hypothetical protein
VLVEREVDAAQHLQLPEGLVQLLDREHRAHAATPDAWRRLRSRATSQSVKRA